MRAFLRIVLFVVIGPPIGTIALVLTQSAMDISRTGHIGDLLNAIVEIFRSPLMLQMGYVMGAIPALIAGIAASILARFMQPGWRYRGWVTAIGAIASIVVVFAMVGPSITSVDAWGSQAMFLLTLALTGAVASLGSLLAFDGLSRAMAGSRVAA